MKFKYTLLVLFFFLLIFVKPTNAQKAPLVTGKTLIKDSLLYDIQLLEKAMTEIHPGIYRYNDPTSIKLAFDQLRSHLYDGMSEGEWMKRLAQCVQVIHCGHTYVNPWNMKKSIRNRLFGGVIYFPMGFQVIDERFYITHNLSGEEQIKKGAEILSINGVSAQAIFDSLSTVIKYDGHNEAPIPFYLSLQAFQERNWNFFDLYFPLFFPMYAAEFEVEVKNYQAEKTIKTVLPALSKEERADRFAKKYGTKALEKERWSFEQINEDLAVIKLGTFAIWNWKDFDANQWFENTFKRIDSLQVEQLVIDIRGNGGGLSDPKNELIRYLSPDTITCGDEQKILIRTTKVDPILHPYCDTWNKIILEGVPSEYYETFRDGWYKLKGEVACQELYPQAKPYQGKTYILGNATNVSATFDLLKKAQKHQFATYVGSPSGGNEQGINGGEYIFFYMPYSGMEVDIPLKYFAQFGDAKDTGIQPDVLIQPTQGDIASGVDPLMEYVIKESKR